MTPDLRDKAQWGQVQKSMEHLTKCLAALEQIRSILGPDTAIGKIASNAIANKPVGGFDG